MTDIKILNQEKSCRKWILHAEEITCIASRKSNIGEARHTNNEALTYFQAPEGCVRSVCCHASTYNKFHTQVKLKYKKCKQMIASIKDNIQFLRVGQISQNRRYGSS